MPAPIHRHHFVKVHGLLAYKCKCGLYYGKSNAGWVTRDWNLRLIGQPTLTLIERGRRIWSEICALFGASK